MALILHKRKTNEFKEKTMSTTVRAIREQIVQRRENDPVSYSKLVTPSEAQWILDNEMFINQRPLDPKTVKIYAKKMQEGQWYLSTISFVNLQNKRIMINGKTRLSAVVEAGTPQWFSFAEEQVTDEHEVAIRYSIHDTHRKRTMRDFVTAYGFEEKTDSLLNRQQLTAIGTAASIIYNKFNDNKAKEHREDILDLAESLLPQAKEFYHSISTGDVWWRRKMMNASIVAVALMTFRHNPEKAREFWKGVTEADRLQDPDDVRKLMRKWLIQNIFAASKAQKRLTIRYITRGIATVWNAYIEGRYIQQVSAKVSKDIRIL